MVARQDSKAAGVYRHRFVKAELGRKIDDRPAAEVAAVHGSPCLMLFNVFIQPPEGVVYPAVKHEFRCPVLHLFMADLIQESNGIVIHFPPEMRIQVGEDADNFRMPRPP